LTRGRGRGRGPTPQQQIISGHGTGNIGGIHFHGSVSFQDETSDPARYAEGYSNLLRRQEDEVARRVSGALATTTPIKSSLVRVWEEWANSPDWYESVVTHSTRVAESIDSEWPGSHVVRTWHASVVRERRTYAFTRQNVPAVDLRSIVAVAQRSQLDEQQSAALRERHSIIAQSCRWLLSQFDEPAFGSAISLAGRFGSGRSQLLTDLAQSATSDGSVALMLSLRPGEGVGNAIRRYVAEATGIGVQRFQDLARFLESAPPQAKVHVLVDDLDIWARSQPGSIEEMQSLIDLSTECGRVRWTFTAEPSQLDAVSGSDPYFWVHHGAVPSSLKDAAQKALYRTTGWLDVDEANRGQLIGFEILRAHSQTELSDINTVAADPETFSHEFLHLIHPLAAWLRLESQDEAALEGRGRQPLTDVNSVAFVRNYWKWVARRICSEESGRRDLERAMRALGTAWTETPGEHITLPAADADKYGSALAKLAVGGLIQTAWIGDAELEDQELRVDATLPAVLGHRIARLIQADTETGSGAGTTRLEQWWPIAGQGLGLAESMCQFSLMLDPPSQVGGGLWKKWTDDRRSPKAPLLMAATASGIEAEELAIAYLGVTRNRQQTKRELFVLMRFVARAGVPGWGADLRIEALKPQARAIVECGLEAYLNLTLTILLEAQHLVTEANYLRVCRALDGFATPEMRELAADLMVRAGARIYADDETVWLRTVMKYCKKHGPRPSASKPSGRSREGTGRRGGPRRELHQPPQPPFSAAESFAASLSTAVSRYVAETRGADGVRVLAGLGWWTASDEHVHPSLADHMRQKLTTEYGSTLHPRGVETAKVDEYAAVVRDLLSGHLLRGHREAGRIAYYLLKHSVPTYGREDVVIHERLRPVLRGLPRNQRLMSSLGTEVRTLLRANGIAAGRDTRRR
jgi:hypothetical protein